jgi:hypothetical protein
MTQTRGGRGYQMDGGPGFEDVNHGYMEHCSGFGALRDLVKGTGIRTLLPSFANH